MVRKEIAVNVSALQVRIGVEPDGKWGPKSHAALLAHFTNTSAPAVSAADIEAIAKRLGCSVKQVNAVSAVESAGGGYDNSGRPKILFERHWFHRLTDGEWSTASFSNPIRGGYNESSWEKLSAACGRNPDAAFSSASWGKFQVMGGHWQILGYPSAYSMAWTTIQSEADHYEMLVRYIEKFGLLTALRSLSDDPDDCRDFAKRYNGSAYASNNYHVKLAEAMA
jgi:hypothetical protein